MKEQIEEDARLLGQIEIDPVCHMEVIPGKSIDSEFKGKKYYFCNPNCKVAFERDPLKYITPEGEMRPEPLQEEVEKVSKKEPKLKCSSCGATEPVPMHCGRPMHIEKVDGTPMLVCWMGPGCGKQAIPTHHDQPMEMVE